MSLAAAACNVVDVTELTDSRSIVFELLPMVPAGATNDDLVLHVAQGRPGKNGVFLQGAGLIASPFRDGILCVGNPTERLEFTTLDGSGAIDSTVSIVTEGVVSPGQTRYYQFWYRDGMGPCDQGSNLTGGFEVVWQ